MLHPVQRALILVLVSIGVHIAAFVVLLWLFPPPPPFVARAPSTQPVIYAAILEPERKREKKQEETDPEPPPPEVVPERNFGEKDGAGRALTGSTLETPQVAQQASSEQAALTRDPAGDAAMASAAQTKLTPSFATPTDTKSLRPPEDAKPAELVKDLPAAAEKQLEGDAHQDAPPTPPSPAKTKPADFDAESAVAAAAPLAAPDMKPTSEKPGERSKLAPELNAAVGEKPTSPPPAALAENPPDKTPVEGTAAAPRAPSQDSGETPGEQSAAAQAAQDASKNQTAGRPAESTDRDSDAFSTTPPPSAEFRNGKVVAQKGREFKMSRPKENLYAFVDGATLTIPARMVFKLRIDPAGKVRNVTVVRSCGSRSIDRAFELALYDSWFEPATTKAGKAVFDEFEFPITLQ